MADDNNSIARRYAVAFLDLGRERNAIDQLLGDLERLVDLVNADGGRLIAALANPSFSVNERRGVLTEVLVRTKACSITRNLAHLMLDRNRLAALPQVLAVFREMADVQANRARVHVETAEPLSPQLEAEVRSALERLTGKQVVLDLSVNPDLIAGMVARVGGKVYDASVRARLDNLRQTLNRAQLPEGAFGAPVAEA
jgi:F-type H+-transporting ATPase subunit delta